MMRRAIVFAALLLWVRPATAQVAVFDAANYAENLFVAARALEQVNNQIQALQNQAQMLANQSRNLTSLDMTSLDAITGSISQMNRAMARAQGILFEQASVDRAFADLYPSAASQAQSSDQLVAAARARWQNSMYGLQQSMGVQSEIAAGLGADQIELSRLVGASQSAAGQLQAVQVANQLAALQAAQTTRLQAMLAAQGRAQELEMARRAADEAQAREQYRRFLGAGEPYVPVPVQMFHN